MPVVVAGACWPDDYPSSYLLWLVALNTLTSILVLELFLVCGVHRRFPWP